MVYNDRNYSYHIHYSCRWRLAFYVQAHAQRQQEIREICLPGGGGKNNILIVVMTLIIILLMIITIIITIIIILMIIIIIIIDIVIHLLRTRIKRSIEEFYLPISLSLSLPVSPSRYHCQPLSLSLCVFLSSLCISPSCYRCHPLSLSLCIFSLFNVCLSLTLPLSNSLQLRRWYLGIQSKKDPAHVMTEVYKAMQVNE